MRYITILFFLSLQICVTAQNTFTIGNKFYNEVDSFLALNVKNGKVKYTTLEAESVLEELITIIANADVSEMTDEALKAFYINAYNLWVIRLIKDNLPVNSVFDIKGFFDDVPIEVAGKQLTINILEKQWLLKQYLDARLHLVLVCGALDCPPLSEKAYRPEKLDTQLDTQTAIALNNPRFIRVSGEQVWLSEIFRWYSQDFGGTKKAITAFINEYRTEKITSENKISYYNYDWGLNEALDVALSSTANNSARYVASMTVPKSTAEIKIFNNLYTQSTNRNEDDKLTLRTSYFTSWWSLVFGVNDRFNLGLDIRYRRTNNIALPSSPLEVFNFSEGRNHAALSNFGPKIRWAPFQSKPRFSIQSAIWFPLSKNLQGTENLPFLDWDSAIWWTQFFNDISIGSNYSLFLEVDVLWEDIGQQQTNRISTPTNAIFSYHPNQQITLYGLGSISPYWYKTLDIFVQAGIGTKYQVNPNLEFELLYTAFTNPFLVDGRGRAGTYNFGIRFNQ